MSWAYTHAIRRIGHCYGCASNGWNPLPSSSLCYLFYMVSLASFTLRNSEESQAIVQFFAFRIVTGVRAVYNATRLPRGHFQAVRDDAAFLLKMAAAASVTSWSRNRYATRTRWGRNGRSVETPHMSHLTIFCDRRRCRRSSTPCQRREDAA